MLCHTNVGDYVTIECAVDKMGWQALGKAQSAWLQFILTPAFFLEYTCTYTFKIKCNVSPYHVHHSRPLAKCPGLFVGWPNLF